MEKQNVTVFRSYKFNIGQKIRIEGSRREGDWEVVGITENKVTLKCPISHREFTWDNFCYHAEVREGGQWPLK